MSSVNRDQHETPDGDAAVSPRIAALNAALAAGNTDAVARFWAESQRDQTPLLDPSAVADTSIATFLWRDTGDETRAVLLVINSLTDRHRHNQDITPYLMEHIPGTDIWYKAILLRNDFRAAYQIFPYDRQQTLEPENSTTREAWMQIMQEALPDPLNPAVSPSPRGEALISVVALPTAPPQPWRAFRSETPHGQTEQHRITSTILANPQEVEIYLPGAGATRPPVASQALDQRDVTVYLPSGYRADAEPYPLLILFDGEVWGGRLAFAPTLDNLIAEGQIPPFVALMVHNIDMWTRAYELPCYPPFVAFLAEELLPWAAARWSITRDPARIITAGQSFGGLAAAFAAHHAPQQFGNVLSLSGSYWWQDWEGQSDGAEWLTKQIAAAPQRPISWYLAAGLHEEHLLDTNRQLRDLLQQMGYDLTYEEYNGGHDYVCWRGGLADGLRALTRDWEGKR